MNSEENAKGLLLSCIEIPSFTVENCEKINCLTLKESLNRKRLKSYYESQNVNSFFKLLQKNENILFGHESKGDKSLFEDILKTDNHDHAEFIRNIWIKFELWKKENMLTTCNSYSQLPIDYIIKSGSSLNLICFLVYDFNTPNKVKSEDDKKYFLNLKSQQYSFKTSQTIFKKLYSIIEDEKIYQEICIQIIEELLKAKDDLIMDIEIETSIEYVLQMKNLHYSTEILKLLVFYWDIEEKPDQFEKYSKILAQKSPFCELMLNLKGGTKHNFQELFYRYLNEMKLQFKGKPNLHKINLQKDRKYLMNHKSFSIKYRSYGNKYYIIKEIPDDPKLLDLHDDMIFTILSEKQKNIQEQIMNSSNTNKLNEILKTTNYQEVLLILLARSQDKPENILEQMIRKPDNIVNDLIQKLCSEYEMESFYTEKMLLMRNPLGKQLMDYVIESGDDKNMFKFLMSNFADNFADNFIIKQSLLVLKNEQLKEKTDKTIFLKMYEIIPNNADMKADCMLILESLLHEMMEIDDIEFDCDIQTVLAMKPIYRDEILRLLVIYWKIDSFNYEKYKNHPMLNEKIYDLMIMLKNQNDENFNDAFPSYLIEMMRQHKENYQSYVQKDANILLTLALRYGQKRAMETIVTCQSIEVNKIKITTDKSVSTYKNINFLMKLMLKYGYNVHDLNHSWVNVEVFEDNLDERIIEEDQNNIIIDYKSSNNDDESIINQDDNESLFSCYNILNNRCLKNNMTHPVLSTFINLKALKYHRFNVFNFWIFIVIHMLPFYVLLSYPNQLNTLLFWLIYFVCILGTCFLIIREFIELIISEKAIYFKKRSNYIEIVLIVLSVLVLMLIPQGTGSNIMTYSSALLKRLKNYYEVKNVDAFFKLLQKNEHILFGRESKDDINLFEEVLRTNNHDHAEFIRKIWIKFELWKNKNMLTTYNSYMKLPIDYINESGSSLNLICFLVYDFNTRKKVKSKDALALRYGQKRAMETIVACQTIEVSKIRITTDKSVLSYEDVNFLMKLMLKYGYNVHDLNHSWVNVDVFEDNLDDRIIEDQHNIIIDYKSFNNDKGSYINQDDSGSLFSCYNILNNRCLKNNMTHPVLSTFINLKALKYHRFNVFNYWIFIAIHMLPFYVLLSYPNHLNKLWLWLIYFICILGTGFLIMREFIQFIISDTAKYFKKPSNYIEIVLIVLSVLVLMLIPQGTGSNIMTYSSALLI
ncbi:unnamed protein product [Diamesa hyperborea]